MSALDPGAIARRLRRLYPRGVVRHVLAAPDAARAVSDELARYRDDPVGFIRDVLGKTLTPDQETIAVSMTVRPARVKVNSGHSLGKTFLAACLVLWWFYTRPNSVVISTAPTERDVIDLLWTEVRLLHRQAKIPLPDFFAGPRAPELFDSEEHWAKGYTARRGESFQGRHRESMLFVFDEAEGVDPIYWQTTDTMFQPDADHGWLAIGNPVTTSSQSYVEDTALAGDGGPKWRLYSLSALNHPNVVAQLAGSPPPIPNAVSLGQVQQWVAAWTNPVSGVDRKPTDLEWPPGSGKFVRPGPSFKARVMGVRPTDGVDTVWGMALWELACQPKWSPAECWLRKFGIRIGLDAAAYGDDDTAIHVVCGPLSLHHEAHNGWGPGEAAGRLKELSREWAAWYNAQATEARPPILAEDVPVTIEFDGGYGVGVHSHCGHFRNWVGVTMGGGCDAVDVTGNPMYANVRAEAWFGSAALAAGGLIDVSRLPADARERLRVQLTAPIYKVQPDGSRLVESKKDIKKRLGRSPDDADALVLAHYKPASWMPTVVTGDPEPAPWW